MKTIARQSIKGSIYSYFGMVLGFINVALLMPKFFSSAEIGLINILLVVSAIFGQFGCLGINTFTIKEFPHYRNKKDNGFLLFILSVGTLGFIICLIILFIFKPQILAYNIKKSPLLIQYLYLLIPFIFITIFQYIIDTYNRVLFNASFGLFVKEFLQRILIFIGIVLFYLKIFDYNYFIIYYSLSFAVPLFCICVLLIIKKQFSLKFSSVFLRSSTLKKAINISFFGLIAGVSSIMGSQIDKFLVYHYTDLDITGIYSTLFFFGASIIIPSRALVRISTPIISESFKNKDFKNIEKINTKSTTALLIVGLFIFLIIWSNINNIMAYLPDSYGIGKYVVLFIGLSHLIQTISATNSSIIQYSKYYKTFSLYLIFLIIIIIGLNLLLIPIYGILGAAIASAISYLIDFIIRTIFVKMKFGLVCFNISHVKICLWAALSFLVRTIIPDLSNIYIDSLIKILIICIFFGIPVLANRYSIDINNAIIEAIQKLKHFLRN